MTTWSGPLTGDDGSIVDATIVSRVLPPTPADVTVSVTGSPASPQSTGATVTITASVSPSAAAGAFVLTQDGVTLASRAASSGSAVFTVTLPATAQTVNYFVTFNSDDPKAYRSGVSAGPVTYVVSASTITVPDTIVINGVSHAVSGVNRDRATDELILYTTDIGTTTLTNQYGTECTTSTVTTPPPNQTIVNRTGTVAETASGTSITGTLPGTAQTGDLFLAFLAMTCTPAQFTGPSGWTQVIAPTDNGAGETVAVYSKVSATTAPVGTSSATAGRATCIVTAHAAVDATTPLDATGTVATANATSVTAGAVSASTTGDVLLSVAMADTASRAWVIPTGMTTLVSYSGSTVGRALAVAAETRSGSGSTGTRAWSLNPSATLCMAAANILIKPAAGTGGGTVTTTIGARTDRQTLAQTTGITIPAKPDYVVSGHGTSRDYLNTNAAPGASVVLKAAGSVITSWPGGTSAGPTVPGAATLAGSAGSTVANLTWSGVTGATGYNVYQGTGNTQVKIGTTSTPGFTVTGLTNGTAYSFQVSAVNSAGEGTKSNTVTITPTASSTGLFYLGASGEGVGNGRLAAWQTNHAVRMAGTWSDSPSDTVGDFSNLTGEFGSWTGPIDVAVGGLRNGQTWAAAANGDYNAQWSTRFNNLKAAWGSRPASLLWVRIAHEFNLTGPLNPTDADAANFVAAFRRWATLLQTIIPGAHPVWSPNDGGNVTNIDAFWPSGDKVDAISVDKYNSWPHLSTLSQFTSHTSDHDSHGNPVGAEAWRQYALSKSCPMYFGEVGNPAVDDGGAGGGDTADWFTFIENFCEANAANSDVLTNPKGSPGRVLGAVWFNIGDGTPGNYPAHFRFWVDATGAPDPVQPLFAAAFKAAPVIGTGGTPPPPPPPPSTTYPTKEIAGYHMMWSTNGPDLTTVNVKFNVIRLAFGTGSGPTMVGWSSDGLANFKSKAAAMRSRGVRFTLSLGGGGQSLDPSNTTNFVNGVDAVRAQLGFLDGVDWDWESGWNDTQVRAVSAALVAKYGSSFAITLAPNGSNVTSYLATAVALNTSGLLTSYGQQFYDAPVSVSAAAGRISDAVAAGIPISKISVGMMIAADANHWTNAQCKANMASLMSSFPGLQRCYLWELQRTGTDQWASDMAGLLAV